MSKVTIPNMRTNKVTGKVKAFFTVSIGSVEIDDLRLIDGSNGRFVGFPSKKIKTKTGEEKYIDLVRLARDSEGKLTDSSKKVYDEILEAANKEYDRREGVTTTNDSDEDGDLPF